MSSEHPRYPSKSTASSIIYYGYVRTIQSYLELVESGNKLNAAQQTFIGDVIRRFENELDVRHRDPLEFGPALTQDYFYRELLVTCFRLYRILPEELINFLRGHLVNAKGELLSQDEFIRLLRDFLQHEQHAGFNNWVIENVSSVSFVVRRDDYHYYPPSIEDKQRKRHEEDIKNVMHLQLTTTLL